MEQNSLEDEIRRKLAPLNRISIPKEGNRKIVSGLEKAIEAYESGIRNPKVRQRHERKWIAPTASAAVFLVAAGGITYYALSKNAQMPSKSPIRTVAHKLGLSSINYSAKALQSVQGTARQTGVGVYLPQKVFPGGSITVIKNGGKGTMILDYKRIWIIESNKPISTPKNQYVTVKQSVNLTDHKQGTFYRIQNKNNALYFKQGKTYIAIQHLSGQLPNKQQLVAIGNSLKALQSPKTVVKTQAAHYTPQQTATVKSLAGQLAIPLYLPSQLEQGDSLTSVQQVSNGAPSAKTVKMTFHHVILRESTGHLSVPGGISDEKNVQLQGISNARFTITELKRSQGNIQSASYLTFKKGKTFIQIGSQNGDALSQSTLKVIAESLLQVK